MENKLRIIRGLPGSGKSTLAKSMEGFEHIETDMWFMLNGEYKFDLKNIRVAHMWCQDQVLKMLKEGKNVVVSNTFTQIWEMKYYLDLAKKMKIVK